MRKFLLLSTLLGCALTSFAQTESNPYALNIGENQLTNPGDDDDVYYVYTAPQDQEVTVFSPATWQLYADAIECDANGREGNSIPFYNWYDKVNSTSTAMFRAKAGQKYFVRVATDSPMAVIPFEVSTEPMRYELGLSCSDPMQMGSEAVMMPLSIDYGEDIIYNPVYGTFTPNRDCVIELITDWFPMRISCSTSCDGEWVDVPVSSTTQARKWHIEGKKNQKYIFKVEGTTPTKIWAYERDYVKGESGDYPFDAIAGKNVLPAAAGTYWYKVTAPRLKPDAPDNYIELSGKINLTGGSSAFMTWADHPEDAYVADNTIMLRHRVISNQTCVLRIVRAKAAAADEAFDIKFNPQQEYDTFDSAPAMLAGFEEDTPGFAGTYYYSIKAPEESGLLLNVTTDYQPKSEDTHVALYNRSLGLNYMLTSATTNLSYNAVEPGQTYVIAWTTADNDFSIPFKVTFDKAPQGDTADWPFDAVAGNNAIPAGEHKYFSYTATKDGWLKLAPTDMNLLELITYQTASGAKKIAPAFSHDTFYKVPMTKGTTYTMAFADIPANSSFSLTEMPYDEGDIFSMAKPVDGSFSINEYEGLYWYKYEVPKDGQLEVSTTLKFAFGHGLLEGTMSAIAVYVNNEDDYTMLDRDLEIGTLYPATVTVEKGDIVYLEIGLTQRANNIRVNLNIKDALPGETPKTPIMIENQGNPTTYRFPAIEWNSAGTWYGLDLYPGQLEMTANTSLLLELYSEDDLTNPITRGGFLDYDDETDMSIYGFGMGNDYYPTANITKEGKYLLCIKFIGACDATFKGSALTKMGAVDIIKSDGISISTAGGELTVNGADTIEVYTLTGCRVAYMTGCQGEARVLNLGKGIYVVRADNKSVKVSI